MTAACHSPCLTDCEVEELARLSGESMALVRNRESWMCAAMHDGYLPRDFELSQSYLFFWDKIERANFFLQTIIETPDEPFDGRLIQCTFLTLVPSLRACFFCLCVF